METRRCPGCMKPVAEPVCPHCGWPEEKRNEPHQLQPGTLLRGQYEIGRVLGQGGFGITYLGWDRHLETMVCIKEYFPNHAVSRDCTVSTLVNCHSQEAAQSYQASKERFLREAKVLARFRDIPEIVGIYNFFEENNTAYIVMEYIRGTDLAHYMARKGGVLTAEETFRILKPIMQAMAAVHGAELVHRDIAPDNIMLHPRGGAKLLDFGAARMVENAGVDKGLGRSTEAIVKHGFAPMEQYQSRGNLGPWTDVYAMCATVYYCLTGQIPPEATSRMMGEAELDWNSVPGLTPQQRCALEKGMAIHARDRYASMEELMEGLFSANAPMAPTQGLGQGQRIPPEAPAPRKKGKKGLWIGLIAALVLVALGAAALVLLGGRSALQEEAPATYAPPAEPPATAAPAAPAPSTEPARNQQCRVEMISGTGVGLFSEMEFFDAMAALPGYDLTLESIFLDTVDQQVEWILEEIEGHSADAILWAPGEPVPEDRLTLVQETADVCGVPVVLTGLDPAYETGSCPAIEQGNLICFAGADPRTVGRRLGQVLETIGLDKLDVNGDNRISYLLLGEELAYGYNERIPGALEAEATNAHCLEARHVSPTREAGRQAVIQGYDQGPEVIVCLREELALGAVTALEEMGLLQGQDIFIVTVGDEGLREMVDSGQVAGGVRGSYALQFEAIRQAMSDALENRRLEEDYRISCELVLPGENPGPEAGTGVRGVVTAAGLNIRTEPKMDARAIGQYEKGDVVELLTIENGWGRTKDGWVVMAYIQLEEESQTAAGEEEIWAMVTVGELNIHTAPGINTDTAGFLVYGTQVRILETQTMEGREWALIDGNWIQGWVLMAYLEIGGSR